MTGNRRAPDGLAGSPAALRRYLIRFERRRVQPSTGSRNWRYDPVAVECNGEELGSYLQALYLEQAHALRLEIAPFYRKLQVHELTSVPVGEFLPELPPVPAAVQYSMHPAKVVAYHEHLGWTVCRLTGEEERVWSWGPGTKFPIKVGDQVFQVYDLQGNEKGWTNDPKGHLKYRSVEIGAEQ